MGRSDAAKQQLGACDMVSFGIVGMSFGFLGFILALNAMNLVASLEKRLKEAGVLGPEEKAG